MFLVQMILSPFIADASDEPANVYFDDDFSSFDEGALSVSARHPAYTSFTNASAVNLGSDRKSVIKIPASAGNQGGFSVTCPPLDKEWQIDFMFDRAWTEYSGIYFTLHNTSDDSQLVRFAILPTVGWAQLQTIIPGQQMQWSQGFAASVNTWYTVKMRLRSNTVYIKMWQAGQAEPDNWGYTITGSGIISNSADTLSLFANEDGATTNVYVDNMTVRTWDESKAPVYDDKNPKYTYYEDDFSSYVKDTAMVVDTNTPMYTEFNGVSVVKLDDTRTDVLKISSAYSNNGKFSIACPTTDKQWSYQLMYDANWDGYNGIYNMLHKETDSSACQLAFLPTAGNPNQKLQIVAPDEQLEWSAFKELSANIWYNFKLRLRENILYVKVYECGTDEPEEWTYTKPLARTLTDNDADILSFLAAQSGTNVNTYIDNMKIETWEKTELPTVKTDKPEFEYYKDDFASYDKGTLEKSETNAIVSAIERASISENGELILSSDNQGHNSKIKIALPKAEKQLSFNFKFSRGSSAWGRMIMDLHTDADDSSYSYSVLPGVTWGQGMHLQLLANGYEQFMSGIETQIGVWYSCTVQLHDGVMAIKIWEKGTDEPEAWTFSYTLPNELSENDADFISITNYEQDGGYNDLYIDDLTISTWQKVETNIVKVKAQANNNTMGTTTGSAEYLAGTTVTVEATANRGYRFVGWKLNDETVIEKEVYTFVANEDTTIIAQFIKAELEIKSITAVGQTQEAVIDNTEKTIRIRLAHDVDLSSVDMYFYTDPDIETEESNFLLDLSFGSASVGNWTVYAEQNTLMTTFYVDDKNGSDKNDGLTEKTSFKTLEKAKKAAEAIEKWNGDVLVKLAYGVHSPQNTLTFRPGEGGKDGYALIFDGGDSSKTVISGGVRITKWTKSDVFEGAYEADIPALPKGVDYVRDLYVDGKRATLARSTPIAPTNWDAVDSPNFEKKTNGYILSGDMTDMVNWRNKSDIELVFEQGWKNHVIPITDITSDGNTVFASVSPELLTLVTSGLVVNDPNYIQNALELLDEPGECYYDRTAGKVYYIPEEGKSITDSVIVMPMLEKLVEAYGSAKQRVCAVHFKNISFRHTAYLDIHNGHADLQANFRMTEAHSAILPMQKTPNAITFDYASGIRIESCSFSAMATGAIDYGIGMKASSIFASSFKELGATAVQIGGVNFSDAQPMSKYMFSESGEIIAGHTAEPERVTNGILVLSNDITRVAQQLKGGVGILAGFVSDTTIAHNTITDLPYTGISAGWGWGNYDKAPDTGESLQEWDTESALYRIVIRNNDIHDIMQYLYDGACIYTLSYMPDSVISGNLMYNSRHFGLYNDQGSGGYVDITENIMYKCNYGAYYYHNISNLYTARMKATEKVMHDNFFEWESSTDEYYNAVRNRAGIFDTAPMGKFASYELVKNASEELSVSNTSIVLSENAPVIKTETNDGFNFDSRAKLTLLDSNENELMSVYESENGKIANGFINLSSGEYSIKLEKYGMITYHSEVITVSDDGSLKVENFAPIMGDIPGSYNDTIGDGLIDIDDFIRVLRGFNHGCTEKLRTYVDVNSDGVVSVTDLAIIKKNFGKNSNDYK